MGGDLDPLTRLPRTGTLLAELDARQQQAAAGKETGFMLGLVDIVGLRHINRSHGEEAGNALLRLVARRLQDSGFASVVARVGPDEFALLNDSVTAEGGGQWLRALRARVLRAPFLLAGESVDVEFRLGRRSGPARPPRNLLWDLQREAFIDATRELNQRLAAMERVRVGFGDALTENVRLKADLDVMRDLANRDFLTGLLNRRGGTARLARLVAPFSLAFVDLDNLRLFNELDPLWNAGDEAIVGVADRLRESFGDDDVVRWGGDEYLVLAQDVAPDEIAQRLQRLLDVCRTELVICGRPVTFSAGVTSCRDEPSESARDRAYRLVKEAKAAKATVLSRVP